MIDVYVMPNTELAGILYITRVYFKLLLKKLLKFLEMSKGNFHIGFLNLETLDPFTDDT
jgi:hypothetical protein